MPNRKQTEAEHNEQQASLLAESVSTDSAEENLMAEFSKLKLAYYDLQTQYFESFDESQQQISKYSQLQALIHNTSEGMILFNPDSTVLSFNLAAQTILGYAEIDVMYKTADHIFPHPDKYEGHLIQYLRDVNDSQDYQIFYAKHADGHEIPLRISISEVNSSAMMLFDDKTEIDDKPEQPAQEQEFDLFAINFLDLTPELERKKKIEQQQKDIEYALADAEESNRLKSEFIGNISHELRTPLNGILGLSEILLDSGLSTEQAEYIEKIHSSGKGLLSLVSNILEFTRHETCNIQLAETIQPNKILKSLRDEFATQIENKKLQLIIKKQKGIPDKIELNNTGFANIARCLLDNAVKFTSKGEITVSLKIEESAQQKDLILEVSDSGIGIAESQQENIFDAFKQIDSSIQRRQGGLGLGLNIVKKIVQSLDGNTKITSKQDEGSAFRITVPLNKVTIPAINTRLIQTLRSELGDTFNELITIFTQDTSKQLEKLKLLIEQDDKENIKALLQYLLSSAANIGAERLKYHYSDFIPRVEEQNHDALLEKYQSLLEAFDETSTNLQQLA